MRTTIRLNDQLFYELKSYSLETGENVTNLITKAIGLLLAKKNKTPPKKKIKLPTFKGNGTLPNINLDSTADLLHIMEEHHDIA